ncbi:MAG: hypothetical protein PGN33_22065 [Methylobacterium radiotolerans]
MDGDGLPHEIGGIEILSAGKPITFYGNHHKTGQYFSWGERQPLYTAPEHLPLVTAEQVAEFIEGVQRLRPFARAGRVSDVDTRWTFDAASGLHAPRAVTGDEWTTNDEGLVDDGRSAFLFHLARAVVRSNEAAAPRRPCRLPGPVRARRGPVPGDGGGRRPLGRGSPPGHRRRRLPVRRIRPR